MIRLPHGVTTIIEQLERAGFPAYAVGGGVRDCLRGCTPKDWDVTTAALPSQVLVLFENVRETGLQHGTVTVYIEEQAVEVTTYRQEGAYTDGRHPDKVAFVDCIEQDLARRDFTVNAIAYSPIRGICDPFGGQTDLENRVIRCVGDPIRRFTEDSLRILRGLRFVATTGFEMESKTVHGMRVCMTQLRRIASERVRDELCRMLEGAYVGRALRNYRDILGIVLPELTPMFGMGQHNPYHEYDIWEHTVRAVEIAPVRVDIRWMLLLHDCGKPAQFTIDAQGVGHFYGHPKKSAEIALVILERLRFPHAQRDAIVSVILHHDEKPPNTEQTIRRGLARLGEQQMRDLLTVARCDTVGRGRNFAYLGELDQCFHLFEQVLAQQNCLTVRDLAIDGHDLQALGLKGRKIGQMLECLLEFVLDQPDENTPQALLAHAQKEIKQ